MTPDGGGPERFVRRPTSAGVVLALGFGLLATGLVTETAIQRRIVATTAVGVGMVALGGRAWLRGRSVVALGGAGLALCGSLVVAVALVDAVLRPAQVTHRVVLLPGLLGLWVLAVALVPARFRWARGVVDAGVGLVFLGVLAAGFVRGASTTALVVATAATVLSWDAAENAVSLGGQVGADNGAATARAELVHAGAGVGVAAVAVVVVLGVARLGIDGLPFGALVALLLAAVAFSLGSHR
ncbi:hypothetical protein GRS48_10655 [Halorubrum sp. JWXQ-INN 858]|uniref:DUF7519 family protein n=1 Tax=Halorubrum sp. JWXQ-INN 858 TaxID=2690782 RepID=UPI00135C7A58|nr:hypothetical protein [Halorubrum sp. JWXQ-INN 858]MWV65276.1 hypothetical protein [Halorubrum sp. JWXQ-INN 858]